MILVCAATRTELDACARGIAGRAGFELLLTGVGAANAASALKAKLAIATPSLVVSTGFAGALTSRFDVGAWVTASSLTDGGPSIEATLREAPPPAIACPMASSAVLAQGNVTLPGDAVDMESAALARLCAEAALPLMVARLISDTPARPLPRFLSPFTSALAATTPRAKLTFLAKGLSTAIRDPAGIARVVREGTDWTRALASSWRTLAPTLAG